MQSIPVFPSPVRLKTAKEKLLFTLLLIEAKRDKQNDFLTDSVSCVIVA